MDAPTGVKISVPISPEAAQDLAYYKSAKGPGVLAPHGWYCFGTYGSGGNFLFVSPEPIDTAHLFSTEETGFTGPAIEIAYNFGGTSGRFTVAEIISRVFPAYKAFVKDVMKREPDISYPSGPYPTDKLTYKGKSTVEYTTPAQTDGLGTGSSLKKNARPIIGVAILVGQRQDPDLLLLSARLPPGLQQLTSIIVREVERDAARHPRGYDW